MAASFVLARIMSNMIWQGDAQCPPCTLLFTLCTWPKFTAICWTDHNMVYFALAPFVRSLVVSLFYHGGVVGFVVSTIWFLAALLYFWGLYITSKALTYITTHYRGYDDVDPERVQFIEQMLRDMIDEIKQKELDIAAGAILSAEEAKTTKDDLSKNTKRKATSIQQPKDGRQDEKSKVE
ncbi:unnamed protein product [Strongylus vulgaris]|uniref:Uncharacterized protein n=1 Tax=Strongylus vulgaris TaxID=40348 RepID=A0A3P7LBC4_STRVU|nr:unnamed protein product [Strongylus vulgaris]